MLRNPGSILAFKIVFFFFPCLEKKKPKCPEPFLQLTPTFKYGHMLGNLNHVHPLSTCPLNNLAFSENYDSRIRDAWVLKFFMSDQQKEIKDSYHDQRPGNTGNKKYTPST